MRSMTGFGRGTNSENGKKFIVEVKTVNHRYTDFYIKSPRGFAFIEEKVREAAANVLVRGKADFFISFEDVSIGNTVAILDEGLADSYIEAFDRLAKKYELKNDITAVRLAQFQDVLKIEKSETDQEEIIKILIPALEEALRNLLRMRGIEGENLKNNLIERLSVLSSNLKKIEEKAKVVVQEHKQKLESRLNEILDKVEIDPQRLAVEVAVFADRSCIDEELTRFDSHIIQFREILEEEGTVGRKLDFLVQEMNREINTIGSKSNNIEITKTVIEVKSEIEKVREQIQNIE